MDYPSLDYPSLDEEPPPPSADIAGPSAPPVPRPPAPRRDARSLSASRRPERLAIACDVGPGSCLALAAEVGAALELLCRRKAAKGTPLTAFALGSAGDAQCLVRGCTDGPLAAAALHSALLAAAARPAPAAAPVDLTPLFDALLEWAGADDDADDAAVARRCVLVYGRADAAPACSSSAALAALQADGLFYLDTLYVHEKDGAANQAVFDALGDLTDGASGHDEPQYALETCGAPRLYEQAALLLAHPSQRGQSEAMRARARRRPEGADDALASARAAARAPRQPVPQGVAIATNPGMAPPPTYAEVEWQAAQRGAPPPPSEWSAAMSRMGKSSGASMAAAAAGMSSFFKKAPGSKTPPRAESPPPPVPVPPAAPVPGTVPSAPPPPPPDAESGEC